MKQPSTKEATAFVQVGVLMTLNEFYSSICLPTKEDWRKEF
jgi:hypothetical protein